MRGEWSWRRKAHAALEALGSPAMASDKARGDFLVISAGKCSCGATVFIVPSCPICGAPCAGRQ